MAKIVLGKKKHRFSSSTFDDGMVGGVGVDELLISPESETDTLPSR